MIMKRLENIIKDLKSLRIGENKAWIFDDNGEIRNDVLCCDVLPLLENWKYNEIDFNEELADEIRENYIRWDNTYNWGANISNDIDFIWSKIDGMYYALVKVHRYGDVRGNYTDEFILEFFNDGELWCNDAVYQNKNFEIDGVSYTADLNALSETYEVYGGDNWDSIGTYYEIELKDLINNIIIRPLTR